MKRKSHKKHVRKTPRHHRKSRRNPVLFDAFGRGIKRHVGKRRKSRKHYTRKAKRGSTMAKKRRKSRVKRTVPLYAQFQRKHRKSHKHAVASNPRPHHRRHFIRSRKGKIAVRRYRRRAVVRANPEMKTLINPILQVGAGIIGNTVITHLIKNNLGTKIGFLNIGAVPSGLVSLVSYFLFGKRYPMVVVGSAVATGLEIVKLILPQGIKEMVGLGQLTVAEYNALAYQGQGALPASEIEGMRALQGFPRNEIEGFTTDVSNQGISGFTTDIQETSGFDELYAGGSNPETSLVEQGAVEIGEYPYADEEL